MPDPVVVPGPDDDASAPERLDDGVVPAARGIRDAVDDLLAMMQSAEGEPTSGSDPDRPAGTPPLSVAGALSRMRRGGVNVRTSAAASSSGPRVERNVSAGRSAGKLRRGSSAARLLLVLLLFAVVLTAAAAVRGAVESANAAQDIRGFQAPPLPSATSITPGPLVVVIGDAGVSGGAIDVTSSTRWPVLLAAGLDGSEAPLASAGMAYSTEGSSGSTFVRLAERVPANAGAVILFGGIADLAVPRLTTVKAVTEAVATVAQEAPDARVVVVGPVTEAGRDAAAVERLRSTLRSGARIAGVTWVDPIGAGWLPATRVRATATGGLSAAEQKVVAAHLERVLRAQAA